MELQKLEEATRQAGTKRPKNLYFAVCDFLKNKGQSEVLADWLMRSFLAEGKILPPHKGTPTVSCIVPCYNHGGYLRGCVLSLLKQDYTAFEIIIINDGSTDDTDQEATKIIKEFPDHAIKYIKQQNAGLVRSRNRGITVARGRYILPIDADDLLAPIFLSRTVQELESSPELGFVSTKALFFGHSNLIWPKNDLFSVNFLITNQQTCTTLFRKQMWKELGGYATTMIHGYEDWEFWIRATKEGWTGKQIDEPLFFYLRKADSMITNSRKKDARIKEQIIRLHPDIYDASKLPHVVGDLHRPNWIPPQLIRPEFTIHPRNSEPAIQPARITEEIRIREGKKYILGMYAQTAPAFKKEFLSEKAGFGQEKKLPGLYTKILEQVAKLHVAEKFNEAVTVSANLLAQYPLQKELLLLFVECLIKAESFQAAYQTGAFALSLWNLDKEILSLLTVCLCAQAELPENEKQKMGLLEGARIFSPDSKLANVKVFELQITRKMFSSAQKTCQIAKEYGQDLPHIPVKTLPARRKQVWYVSDSFGFLAGGVNGVSQAKNMTLGSILRNSDLCEVTVITPLTPALPAGIAEFSRQYFSGQKQEDTPWPNWAATVRKKQHSHLAHKTQPLFQGTWDSCRGLEKPADLILVEGIRINPHAYLLSLGLPFTCPAGFMHHNSPHHYSEDITTDTPFPAVINALKHYDFNISVSENVMKEWQQVPGQNKKKWFSIPNCVREYEIEPLLARPEKELRQQLELPEQDFLVLCLASVQYRKGQDILLKQVDRIVEHVPTARFLFVGPVLAHLHGNEIVEMARTIQHKDRVHFLGSKENALEYIHATNLMVLPSREEALPLTIMEAMALGTTCVASNINGIPELVVHEKTGLLFSLEKSDDLGSHIIQLANNREKLQEMGKKARTRYKEKFSRNAHIERWREALMEMLRL